VNDRSYLSIGDVLTLLREEFPDVTISKIRFLESQGLVDPERTPSGYRKFYERDVQRLRWVLRQQREHFLPLKVIKGRLDEREGSGEPVGEEEPVVVTEPSEGRATEPVGAAAARVSARGSTTAGASAMGQPATRSRLPGFDGLAEPETPRVVPGGTSSGGARSSAPRSSGRSGSTAGGRRGNGSRRPGASGVGPAEGSGVVGGPGSAAAGEACVVEGEIVPVGAGSAHETETAPDASESPALASDAEGPEVAGGGVSDQAAASAEGTASPDRSGARLVQEGTGASFSLEELAAAAGMASAEVRRLEDYGMVAGRTVGGSVLYDEVALEVARLAAAFGRYGIEPRHLRLHKHAADREAGFIEQIVLPLLKQRNPAAHRRARQSADELGRLGSALRAALLRSALRDQLG
jgi:DNA-binding transcriptional MerR regulator